MNHGEMAFITKDILRIPQDLLRPVGIKTGSLLHGLYYPPRTDTDNRYDSVNIKHVIVL